MSEIIKGSSIPISSLKVYNVSGVAVNLSALSKLVIYITSDRYKTVFLKLSKTPTTDYQTITLSDDYTVAPFTIPGSVTKLMDTGYMRLSVYQAETNSGVMIDGKDIYMGGTLLKDELGVAIKFVDDPINAEL